MYLQPTEFGLQQLILILFLLLLIRVVTNSIWCLKHIKCPIILAHHELTLVQLLFNEFVLSPDYQSKTQIELQLNVQLLVNAVFGTLYWIFKIWIQLLIIIHVIAGFICPEECYLYLELVALFLLTSWLNEVIQLDEAVRLYLSGIDIKNLSLTAFYLLPWPQFGDEEANDNITISKEVIGKLEGCKPPALIILCDTEMIEKICDYFSFVAFH